MTISLGLERVVVVESLSDAGGDGGSMSMEMAMAGVRIWNLLRRCFGLKFAVGVSMERFSTSESVCCELI